MNILHLIYIIFVLSLFYFIVGSFVAHFLDRIFYYLTSKWLNNDVSKNNRLIKLIILCILQTFFIIFTVHFIRKSFGFFYSNFLNINIGDYSIPELEGIILLGSLYVTFSTHYRNNLREIIHILYHE